MTKTILKWAGNKTKVMPQIIRYFPNNFSNYIEPFAGALGSFLHSSVSTTIHEVYLNDLNSEIINLFLYMKKDYKEIVEKANSLPRDKDSFYEIRGWDRLECWEKRDKIEKAARTIYLNKLCFNGLYRTNPKKGYFNTPYGTHRKNDLLSLEDAKLFVEAIKEVNFSSQCFFEFSKRKYKPNSLFYFDPPYVDSKNPKKEFSGYIGGFGWEEQEKLRNLAFELYESGHNVILSNTFCNEIQELYKGFKQEIVIAPRSISRKSSGRKPVEEMLCMLIH